MNKVRRWRLHTDLALHHRKEATRAALARNKRRAGAILAGITRGVTEG